MKKGLFILNTDNVNQSLVSLYSFMNEKEYDLYCYTMRNDKLSLHAFELLKIRLIEEQHVYPLDQFDFIVCGRNCFGLLSTNELIDYKGIIYTDDTAFYEGRSVFGDVVFVSGKFNKINIQDISDFDVLTVGCLKGVTSTIKSSGVWNNEKIYQTKVLYIESGHYPFGKKGRTVLANALARLVLENPECEFVVKPRFLIGEAQDASHRNEDYLLYYVKSCFNGVLPANLSWLNEYYSLDVLISEADVIIHTYSSAHSQAALQGKKIINLIDIPSLETADFRPNRFNQIKRIIDLAGNNISVNALNDCINKAKKVTNEYVENLGGNYDKPQIEIEKCISTYKGIDFSSRRIKRMRGFFYYLICNCENRFDEYSIFLKKMNSDLRMINLNSFTTSDFVSFALDKVIDYELEYIQSNWEKTCSNSFNRAYALRVLYDSKNILKMKRMLDDSYNVFPYDSSYYFYMSIYYMEIKDMVKAKQYAKKYMENVKFLKYETLDSERKINMKQIRKVINL